MNLYKVALRAELNAYIMAKTESDAYFVAKSVVKSTWWPDDVECESVDVLDIVEVQNEE